MASSVEIRTPLVDFELLKAVAPVIPQLTSSIGKRALANAPSSPLPSHQVERAKTGFSVPTGDWIAKTVEASRGVHSRGLTSRAWGRELIGKHRELAVT
jgi:asparagine synthase (glutamine-hydrolysing)